VEFYNRAKTHFLLIPKIRAGLTQLSKADEGHKALLGGVEAGHEHETLNPEP